MVVQRLMGAIVVVELKISAESVLGLTYLMVIVQINLLVLYTAPEPLHEYIDL